MRRYETIFIVQVDLPHDEIVGLIERYRAIITERKGIVVKIEEWGERKLAYKIKKQTKGYYIFIDFVGIGHIVDELERNFKIDDRILRFITVKKKDKVDLKEIENEIAGAGKEEKEAPTQSDVKPTDKERSE